MNAATLLQEPSSRSSDAFPDPAGIWPQAISADFAAKVISVQDRDTLEVLHNTHPERIRLSGTDCPEKGQAFGKRAKQAASELVFGKQVRLQTHSKDKFERTLADVLLLDGTHVNPTLMKKCWGRITLVNRPTDRHAVLTRVNGDQRDFSRPAETVH
jgi:endonuclease YncB( thermonuclease family)